MEYRRGWTAGVFLVLAGADITGYGAAFGFGLFFFARGIGTGIGPLIVRSVFKDKNMWPSLIGILVAISGFFYLIVGLTLDILLPLTVILIIISHAASGGTGFSQQCLPRVGLRTKLEAFSRWTC